MDYRDRHVVVTGGTGALGRAVVGACWRRAPIAMCPIGRSGRRKVLPTGALSLIPVPSLADETAVTKLYGGLPSLWASIHIAGGFAFAPLTDTSGELLRRLIDDNLVSCFLCCREAVAAMRRGRGRPAGASSMWRRAKPWSRATGRRSAPLPPPRPASPHSPRRWARSWRGRESW